MHSRILAVAIIFIACRSAISDDKQAVMSPAEAAKKVNQQVTVKLEVKSAALRNGVCFLNSDDDFKSAQNFTIFIGKEGLKKFQDAKIADPAEHFKGKTVQVKGKVVLYRDRPEIVVDDPAEITIVEKK